jgi:hypothetical protein
MDAARQPASGRGINPPAIEEQLAKALDRYRGKWVAIDGNRVVAVGDSAREVVEKAREQRITDPRVFRVPVHPERIGLL